MNNDAALAPTIRGAADERHQQTDTHLEAIAVDAGGRQLLEHTRVEPDDAIVKASDFETVPHHAARRMWPHESLVRKRY